jgi:malate synthase
VNTQTAEEPIEPLQITAPFDGYQDLLTDEACNFLIDLHQRFSGRIESLLARRRQRQAAFDAGQLPDFLPETQAIRAADWRVDPIPEDLLDRRVEITGPVDRKMIINALNSGAKVFMADFEDAHSPTWSDTLAGQRNLFDAVRRTISFESAEGKTYRLGEHPATLIVRPRGLHLEEKHFRIGSIAIPACLFDFGLYLFHNATELLERGTGPYFYLPKLESHLEAEFWNDCFIHVQERLGIPRGTIKATVLIETLPAAFEMDEILFALREHIVGLNCGRWDYIFSFIKCLHADSTRVMPDRAQADMSRHFLRSYSRLLIRTCHRRGAFAMGGMAAQIPVKGDSAANAEAFAKVRMDKEREATNGHDGTWVAHPGLVPVAMEVFDRLMPGANQLDRPLDDDPIGADDLLAVPDGTITEAGVRNNVAAALRYLAAWLGGRGAVPINNLMEDAATAEIARAQLWQWIRYPDGRLDDGRDVTAELFRQVLRDELDAAAMETADDGHRVHLHSAAKLLAKVVEDAEFAPFITLPAYDLLD